jgi:hypothetical protein
MKSRKENSPLNRRPEINPHRRPHLALAQAEVTTATGATRVTVDEAESPLAWLARRKGRDGRPLIEAHQFLAGERLRADFTRANMMPRTTSNWDNPVAIGRGTGSAGAGHMTDLVVAARQGVQQALKSVGPEVSGLLLDICCFLKRLEDVERERAWPARSAKVVLQLALDRLARHYGLNPEAHGCGRPALRTWLADDAALSVESSS